MTKETKNNYCILIKSKHYQMYAIYKNSFVSEND